MTVHRVKLKDLNKEYIRQLQDKYKDPGMEIEIRLLADAVSPDSEELVMNEEIFWQIISLLDWEKASNDEAVIEPAVQQLASMSEASILTFYDLLSEKLYLLDGKEYAIHSTMEESISADLFLYSRCGVVANGQSLYEKVLKDPTAFPKDLHFEILLSIPEKAWFRHTGKPFNYIPKYIYETGFNPNGWGADTITL